MPEYLHNYYTKRQTIEDGWRLTSLKKIIKLQNGHLDNF